MAKKVLKKIIEIDSEQRIQDISQEIADILKKEFKLITAACFLKGAEKYTFETSSKGPYHRFINLIAQHLKDKRSLYLDQSNLIMDAVRKDTPTIYDSSLKEFDATIGVKTLRALRSTINPGKIMILPCRHQGNTEVFIVLVFHSGQNALERAKLKDYSLIGNHIAQIFNKKLVQEDAIALILDRVKSIVSSIANQETIPEIGKVALNLVDANVFFNTTVFMSVVDNSFEFILKSDNAFIKFADKLVNKYAKSKKSKKTFLHNNLMNKSYRERKPLYTPDVAGMISPPLPRPIGRYIERHMKTQEVAALPCCGSGSEVMAMLITSTTSSFTPTQKKLLEILAQEIGYAIENKMLLKEAHDEKNQLISIIDHSSDGIMVFEGDELIYVSPKMSEITEYTVEEIEESGDGNFLLIPEERKNVEKIANERQKFDQKTSNYFSKVRTKTGNTVPVEITTVQFKRGGKDFTSVTFRDMSRTNEAVEKLENLYSNQGKFFSEIAHSLKTPFTVIYGLLELEDDDPSTYKETFDMIKEELDTVNKKISDLLKISKMEILDYPIKMKPISLNEFLDAFYAKAKSLGYKYCERNHNFECNCFKYRKLKKRIKINADIEVLMDIFMTLAENSYIHSPRRDEKPNITLKVNKKEKEVEIVLEDEGKGISKTEVKNLFKPFAKKLFKPTGHGIGLPMCKKMVEKMNGKIKVKSELGKGATFIITFPVI